MTVSYQYAPGDGPLLVMYERDRALRRRSDLDQGDPLVAVAMAPVAARLTIAFVESDRPVPTL